MASPILDSSGNPMSTSPPGSNVVAMRPAFAMDSMANILSGRGTSIDKRTYNSYFMLPVDPQQAEIAYRSDWIMRKIVDIPPLDMTRAWRAWQTDKNTIELLEKEERRLRLKAKAKRALILARLWGGSAIIIGNGDADTMQPLKPGTAKGALRYLNVYSRYQVTAGPEITDPESDWCGQPEKFTLQTSKGPMDLHPSRVIAFVGQPKPEGSLVMAGDWFWGDPIMQSVNDAVKNAAMAQDGFAALIDEARVDIIKTPDLTALAATSEYETRMLRRLSGAAMGKSTWRTLLLDDKEEWNQHQVTWTGMPDIITSYLQIVSGAADIPVTRLLGQSPKGLQSTGEGEDRDYKDMIAARQEEMLQPALDRVDELLIPSALGSVPSDIWWQFNSLDRTSPKDAAEIEAKRATTVKTYADTGLFPDDALASMAKNAVIESGQWPGSEAAFEEAKLAPGYEGEDEDDLLTAEERAGAAAIPQPAITDAAPRSLYVCRKVVNVADLKAWAKSQGLPELQDDLHVTVVYSKAPVDWMKIEGEWNADDKGQVTVPPGGVRIVEPLGDRSAVLLFTSSTLSWRHEVIVRAGASHDYDDYQPHISLTGGPVDLSNVEPYRGKIVLGPEIFEEINQDEA